MKKNELPLDTDLTGQVAVITGAGGLICSMLAETLAASGAKVALLDLSFEKAEKCADNIRNDGGIAKAYACNVLDKDQIKAVHEKVIEDLGKCTILINGAGGNSPKATTDNESVTANDLTKSYKSFFDLDSAGVQFVFNLNFLGTLLPTQEFAADMLEAQKGNIINISSMNAYRPLTKIPAYSAAKAGISNFTEWLAVYFAKLGIRVNAIAPGFFSTAQNKSLLWNSDGTPTPRTGKIIASTPMGRFGEVKEISGSVLFLLNEKAAGFITGIVLPIDGGFNAYSGV